MKLRMTRDLLRRLRAEPTEAPEPAYADRAAAGGPYAWEALSGVELQKVLGGVEELGGELLRLYADAHTLGLLPPDALGLVGASAIGELILRPMAPRVRSRWRIEPPTVPDRDDEPGDGDEPPSPEEAPTSPAPAEKLQHADPRSMSRKQRSSTLGASLPMLS